MTPQRHHQEQTNQLEIRIQKRIQRQKQNRIKYIDDKNVWVVHEYLGVSNHEQPAFFSFTGKYDPHYCQIMMNNQAQNCEGWIQLSRKLAKFRSGSKGRPKRLPSYKIPKPKNE